MIMISENIIGFEEDFKQGMSARELKEKYNLSNRGYRFLKEKLKLHRNTPVCKVKTVPKNYYPCSTGGFTITKMVNGKMIYFCHVNTEEQAKEAVEKFRECDWNKEEKHRILYEIMKK